MFTLHGKELYPYRVGALMYVPALNFKIAEKLCTGKLAGLNSLAFCLEDAITESSVKEAEVQLLKTLSYISERADKLPFLFVRVRSCSQLERLPYLLGNLSDMLTGIIFPKFDLSNAIQYCQIIKDIRTAPLYFMPILESDSVMRLASRKQVLFDLRQLLDTHKDYLLNIRVGVMDFCRLYGLRRTIDRTIYDIMLVRDVLTDILNVFADDYVVSAPVWEYFQTKNSDESWAVGMEKELRLDLANGFIGKTVIHPSQIKIVQKWLQPINTDVEDAKLILKWEDKGLGVAKGITGNRMNELPTHKKWANKIMIMSEIYGIREP